MNKRILMLITMVMLVTSCKSTDVNPLHVTDQYQDISEVNVKYVIPTKNLELNRGIAGVTFDSFRQGKSSKQNKLFWKKIDERTFEVHRRVDNGISGSGKIYIVNYSTVTKGDDTIITFNPIKTKSYQQGFIGKFDVPEFNINNFLSSSNFKYKFEINSDFPSNSVKGNFDRLLRKKVPSHSEMKQMMLARMSGKTTSSKDWYVLDSYTLLNVESFPYRNGSKVVIEAKIRTKKNSENLINLSELFKSINSQIVTIVNS